MSRHKDKCHDEDVLELLISHILYELQMVIFAFKEEQRLDGPKTDGFDAAMAHNMALECFLIHFRILRDFFMADMKYPKENDFFAWEFSGAATPKSYASIQLAAYDIQAMSRRVAHLTTDRHEKHSYQPTKVLADLKAAYDEWIADLDPKWRRGYQLESLSGSWSGQAYVVSDLAAFTRQATSSHVMSLRPITFNPSRKK